MKHNISKSIGPQASKLILALYESGHKTFGISDAKKITGFSEQAIRTLVSNLTQKGVFSHLTSGLYNIVPFELGNEREFLGNPYVVAREIVRQKFKGREAKYYISHASAMDIHQMVTQPQLVVYTTLTEQIKKNPKILGTEFRFVTCKTHHYFGIKKHWVDKSELILISDIERTIIDGLKMPEHCGGLTEVAKGLWIKRDQLNYKTLVDYAEKMNVGSVYRRLGYLLEVYGIECPVEIKRLQKKITDTYASLDPTLPKEGRHMSRWRLLMNIPEEEFRAVVRT